MLIRGGVTGIRTVVGQIDTTTLSPGERARIEGLIDSASFFNLPSQLLPAAPRTWDFIYTIEVSDGSRSHSVKVAKESAPANLRELIDAIEAKSSGA